jgi:cyanate lyase
MAGPFAALRILNMAEPFLRESYCIVIVYGRAICSFMHSKYGRAILCGNYSW